MGWEYHKRQRGRNGTFVPHGRKKVQLHLRMTPAQADWLRLHALKNKMGLSEYVLTVIARYYRLQKLLHDRKRRKDRGPLEEDIE